MSQEECSRSSMRISNKKYVLPGSLVSLRNKKISSHQQKHTSNSVPDVHNRNLNENHDKFKPNLDYIRAGSQIQHMPMNSASSEAQTIYTIPPSQAVHEQVQQESVHPTTRASQAIQEQIQQDHVQNSTNLDENGQSEEQGHSTNKRKRGGTIMAAVHGRSERKLIILNELHQPIGPTKAVVKELGSFLGTLARNGTFCPLNILSWKNLKTHDDMWNYIKEKYDIPNVGKEWALNAIDLAWRGYKSRIKKKYFYPYDNDEIRMAYRPKNVPESVFKDLLQYWNSDEAENMSKYNKENRKKLKYPHTVGKTSFAIIREEKKKESPDGVSSKDFFVATRRRTPGRVYKDSYEDTTNIIAEMEMIETQESADGSQSVDAYSKIMPPEHPGRVRLYGRGVTKTLLKRKATDFETLSSTAADDERMQKKMEELEERIQQKMQEKFEAQKDNMERDITMNIIAQLQNLNPGLTIDPNMLRFNVHSSREEAGNQLINRPSDGSNDKGCRCFVSLQQVKYYANPCNKKNHK